MQSFFFEKNQHKIISAQKSLQKAPNSTMNPFYEYITSKKPSNISFTDEDPKNQRPSSVSIPTQPSLSSERKNSTELSDPRRIYALNKIQATENKTENNQNASSPKTQRNPKLTQKRSRSREKRRSKNKQISEDRFGNEKKEEHFKKTKLCPLYEKGECTKGSSCSFAHGFKDLRCLPNFYKTKLCLAFERGECKKPVDECKYAHGEKELRSLKHDAGYSNTIPGFKNKNQKSEDMHKKHKNDRDSESVHRKDKHHKHSHHREDARSNLKEKSQAKKDPLSYKKNIPLSKEYEKFLYGDLNPQSPAVQNNPLVNQKNSMYMVPSSNISSSLPSYTKDAYSINLGKSIVSQQIPLSYSSVQRPYMNPSILSYGPKEQAPLPFFDKSSEGYSQKNYHYPSERDFFSEKSKYPQISYLPPTVNQGYNRPQHANFYQSSPDFGRQFNKNFYQNNNQGSFKEQPYSSFDLKEGRFSDSSPSVPSYGALPSNYLESKREVERPESFYKPDSFYSDVKSLQSQNGSGYRDVFSRNEVYDLYPALDKNFNQPGNLSYYAPTFQQKSRYSGFSNNFKK